VPLYKECHTTVPLCKEEYSLGELLYPHSVLSDSKDLLISGS
jgi:hypothetical protein